MLDDGAHRLRVLTPHLPSPAPVLRRLNISVIPWPRFCVALPTTMIRFRIKSGMTGAFG